MTTSTALPPALADAWSEVEAIALRKRVAIEVRIREGASVDTVGDDLHSIFLVRGRPRSGAEIAVGTVATFSEAIRLSLGWVVEQPELGADVLREELRAHGRRLALLTPRELSHRRRGHDHAIYVDFRDRILPLAWDNLVDSARLEALEDVVRRVAALDDTEVHVGDPDGRVAALVAEARGLVPPKEGTDG